MSSAARFCGRRGVTCGGMFKDMSPIEAGFLTYIQERCIESWLIDR